MTHDAMLDSVAVLALGALPEAEARETAAHVRSCADCRAEYAALRGTADAVGYDAEAAIGDELAAARRKSRIMAAVFAGTGAARTAAAPVAPAEIRPLPARRKPALLPYGLAAAAAIVAIYFGASDASLRDDASVARTRVADLTQQNAVLRQATQARTTELADAQHRADDLASRFLTLSDPAAKRFAVPEGEVIASGPHVYYALRLKPLPAGKVYQAWTLAKGQKTVAPSVTFTPGRDGIAFVELPANAANLAAVALSVEPAGGSKAPTTTPKFVRPLS